MREGEGDDLPGIGRVGEDFLVARHRGVEADFADRVSGRAQPEAFQHGPVGQHQKRGRLGLGPSSAGGGGFRLGHGLLLAHYPREGKNRDGPERALFLVFFEKMQANNPMRTLTPFRVSHRNVLGFQRTGVVLDFRGDGCVRRRDFIGAVAGSAVAWPFSAFAQTAERVRLVGILNILASDDPEAKIRSTIFQQALAKLGWEVGRNLKIETRQVGGDVDRLRRYVTELVALNPDVILSIGSISVGAVQQVTRTIPIVFVNVPDPVGAGFVQNMSHPGGNTTGFSNFEYSIGGKWAELLKQISPRITRALVLRDRSSAAGIGQFASIRSVAQSLGVELTPVDVRDEGEIERGVAAFAGTANGGVIVTAGGTAAHRKLIISLVARYK